MGGAARGLPRPSEELSWIRRVGANLRTNTRALDLGVPLDACEKL